MSGVKKKGVLGVVSSKNIIVILPVCESQMLGSLLVEEKVFMIYTHQLVLVGGDGSEDGLREDKGLVVFEV